MKWYQYCLKVDADILWRTLINAHLNGNLIFSLLDALRINPACTHSHKHTHTAMQCPDLPKWGTQSPIIITYPLSLPLIKGSSWLFWNQRAQTCSLLWCLKDRRRVSSRCVALKTDNDEWEHKAPAPWGPPPPRLLPTASFNYTCAEEMLGEELKESDANRTLVLFCDSAWWLWQNNAFMSARVRFNIPETHQIKRDVLKCSAL